MDISVLLVCLTLQKLGTLLTSLGKKKNLHQYPTPPWPTVASNCLKNVLSFRKVVELTQLKHQPKNLCKIVQSFNIKPVTFIKSSIAEVYQGASHFCRTGVDVVTVYWTSEVNKGSLKQNNIHILHYRALWLLRNILQLVKLYICRLIGWRS